jgi:NACalpha-BTF3-like transcription factor
MPTKDECVKTVMDAAGISKAEAEEALEMTLKEKKRLGALGKLGAADRELAGWAKGSADQAKIYAALKKKQAALNIVRRESLDAHIEGFVKATKGDIEEAFMSILVGSYKKAPGARDSIGAARVGIAHSWVGGMVRELHERPHVERLLAKDKTFVDQVVREMFELKENGRPGLTGNADARFVADIFARYAEASRIRLNQAGTFIRKLGGWVPQSHDAAKLLAAGKDKWVGKITGLLDLERSFPDKSLEEVTRILGDTFETIVTGKDHGLTAAERGEFVGPRNLARSMEHSRVLHFMDADSWLKYQAEFSHGNLVTTIMGHMDRSARKLAVMEKLGPNPETMLGALIESAKRRIREDSTLDPAIKEKRIKSISDNLAQRQGAIGMAFSEVMGETLIPGNVKAAQWASGFRAIQSMAKLGMAPISAINDLMTYAMNARHNGVNLFEAYGSAFTALLEGKSKREVREASYLLGTLYDGMLQDIASRWNAQDSVKGKIGDLMNTFFKYSGLNYWTDAMKSGYSRMMSTHLADQVGKHATWGTLDAGLRQSLEGMGFTGEQLEALRLMTSKLEDGRAYVFPENARKLDSAVIDAMNAEKIAKIRESMKLGKSKDAEVNAKRQADFDGRMDRMRAETRKQLETDLMTFYSDQTKYAVIEPDDRTRMSMVRGTRPGTVLGELIRFVTQFKSFPIAYFQRNLSGGGRWGRPDWNFDLPGITHLVAGSLVLGYAAMTAKDLLKGKAPRDPAKLETWAAAALQSGGAGIYGDFLFSKYDRMGGSLVQALTGPTANVVDKIGKIPSDLLRGEFDKGNFFRTAMDNTPFINMWYSRAALDWAVLYHVREMLSPGTLQRTERRMKEEYNQEYILPPSRHIRVGGGFR